MHKQNMRGFPKNGKKTFLSESIYLTSGTAATLAIPAGATAFRIKMVGGGAAYNINGNDTTFTYSGITYTAPGSTYTTSDIAPGAVATDGDENLAGGTGFCAANSTGVTHISVGGDTPLGRGGSTGGPSGNVDPAGYGGGAARGTYGIAGGAAYLEKRIEVVPGQTTATYTIAASVGSAGLGKGSGGAIIFEY